MVIIVVLCIHFTITIICLLVLDLCIQYPGIKTVASREPEPTVLSSTLGAMIGHTFLGQDGLHVFCNCLPELMMRSGFHTLSEEKCPGWRPVSMSQRAIATTAGLTYERVIVIISYRWPVYWPFFEYYVDFWATNYQIWGLLTTDRWLNTSRDHQCRMMTRSILQKISAHIRSEKC